MICITSINMLPCQLHSIYFFGTIICKLWDQEYLIFTVTRKRTGLTMAQCVDFLMETYDPQWAYNLDGGPSSALMYRRNGKLVRVVENKQANVDIMTFSELVGN